MSYDEENETIVKKFMQSKERKLIKAALEKELEKSGWKEKVKRVVNIMLQQAEYVGSVEEIIDQVYPDAKKLVPVRTQKEAMEKINTYIKNSESLQLTD